MPYEYDPNLDEMRWEKNVDISDPFGKAETKVRFRLRVMQYGNGRLKLDIKKLLYGAGKQGEYAKLGRYAEHEIKELLPAFKEALEYMQSH